MMPQPGRARLATVTIPAPDLRPETFLRHAAGEERGFFARARALGPLTYGPGAPRRAGPAAVIGGRVDIRV